ncbi:MAG: 4-(cytidine 5'-diphospho)-2-C-methyl-D-erythritol kinase [Ginsengibacter sp.]
MIVFPNCKINLGLNIIRKRKDNYHDIETVFYPLDFKDALEIVANKNNRNEFTVTGLPVANTENNLCRKAYNLLKRDYPQLPCVKMHLHKSIPIGAGLGGGSADAAFTLKILKEKFLTDLSMSQLNMYALQLGSDCPFFLHNQPCLASGRGEHSAPISIDLSSYKIMLINPGIQIDTSWAFGKIEPADPATSIRDIITQPVETWKADLMNDFERVIFENYPEIKKIKEILYKAGAMYASLSGSGSTVYGIFNNTSSLQTQLFNDYFVRIINLK